MAENMSIDNLKANLTNPARTYLWNVVFPNPIGGGDVGALTLRCQSSSIPGRAQGQIHVPYKQSGGVEYHGKLTYSHQWACTFIEGEDRKIFEAIYAWMQNIVHDVANVGIGDVLVKTDLILQLVSTIGTEYMRIKLIGCYPMTVENVDLSYANETNISYSVTWSYDSWVRV